MFGKNPNSRASIKFDLEKDERHIGQRTVLFLFMLVVLFYLFVFFGVFSSVRDIHDNSGMGMVVLMFISLYSYGFILLSVVACVPFYLNKTGQRWLYMSVWGVSLIVPVVVKTCIYLKHGWFV